MNYLKYLRITHEKEKEMTSNKDTANQKNKTTTHMKSFSKVSADSDRKESDMGPEDLMKSEQSSPDEIDVQSFPVVGVGASAGGLDAFRELLGHLPADTGMAFVLVQHLDPHHESMLVTLLTGSTSMPVREVTENLQIEPNSVYIIPPDSNMGILHDTLQLVKRNKTHGRFLPVDFFLKTLAADRGNRAIGVILSGSASDGTQGLKAVKATGGITFAQSEDSAEYFGMPGSAIAAGCIDFILPPKEIAREIGRIAHHPFVVHTQMDDESLETGNYLNKVFLILRSHTGHDFTYYKHTTIRRRIKRRMLVHKLERFSNYVRLLEENPAEVEILFNDILINVTGFFRDPASFEELKNSVLPLLMKKRSANAPLRIWVPGCSSGEEAYTLAMIVLEFLGDRSENNPVQIFATDIDKYAIEKARTGIYSDRIVDEVSPGRLKRFFVNASGGGYQVNKTIRDLCIFAEQDVTRDPPFSKIDLICCRNLMIYLGVILQKKVLQIFHYALQSNGFLMLGSSETIGRHVELFRMMDKKHKIYSKKFTSKRINYEFSHDTSRREGISDKFLLPEKKLLLYDLHKQADQMLQAHYIPPGVIINSDMDVLEFRGATGPYLNPLPGNASLNLLKLARQELTVDLNSSIQKAIASGMPVRKEGIRYHYNESENILDIQIIPIGNDEERYMLLLFEESKYVEEKGNVQEASGENSFSESKTAQNRIQALETELSETRSYMQSIIEEQEGTNEELKAANEEIQSTNEELQSTNEELETTKEELQSTNEELATVNDELENRNIELGAANNDLSNLLINVNLPILMLDDDLKIRRFTPRAERLLNLIEADIGRPISQIRSNVEIPDLEKIVGEVIDTMVSKTMEVEDQEGHWHSVRIRPYKTLDNRIEGAVIVFIDIDDIKDAERLQKLHQSLKESERRLHSILDNSATVIYLKGIDGSYQLINRQFEELFDVTL